jgi:DNA-binding beta-propeller fold protein YncE
VKDKPQEPGNTVASIQADRKVLIVNEGNFGWGSGTVSLYDPTTGAIVSDYFGQQNNGALLGNVCQSITRHNNNYYVVVNNSNKIVVVNAENFKKTGTINGLVSPRYLLPVTYNKAYVSDLYANFIQVLDLNTNALSGTIPCRNGTEEMISIYGKAYVSNGNSEYCYVVNTMNDIITDSVLVGKGAAGICIDKHSKIWVLSSGDAASAQTGKLSRIDPVSLQIEASWSFNAGESPRNLCINKTRDSLYFLNNGVFQMQINSVALPTSPLISQGSKIFYTLGINPKDYTIYVSDAVDYVQKSKIEIYSPNGTFITKFNAGIISTCFQFE